MNILDTPQHAPLSRLGDDFRDETEPAFSGHVDGTDFYVNEARLFEVNPALKCGTYVGWIHSPWDSCLTEDAIGASTWWTDDTLQFVKTLAALHQ